MRTTVRPANSPSKFSTRLDIHEAATPSHGISSTSDVSPEPKRRRIVHFAEDDAFPTPPRTASPSTAEKLISLYECAVCSDTISPPILQCSNAHLFCQTCRLKFPNPPKCPKCKEALSKHEIRNIPLEKVALVMGLAFPCKYSPKGCTDTSVLTEIRSHEKVCEYRPFECPKSHCHWTGGTEELVEHLVTVHEFVNNETDRLVVDNNLNELAKCGYSRSRSMVSHKDVTFMFVLGMKQDMFNGILVCIGDQKTADQFQYKIEICNDSDGTRHHFEGRPISVRQNLQSLLFGRDGLHFNHKVAEHCSVESVLKIVISVSDK